MDIAVFVNDDVEHPNKSPDAFSGSRLWSLMFFAGLIGKFFGLLSGAIFLRFWLMKWLWKKNMKIHRLLSIMVALVLSLTTINEVIAQETQFRQIGVGSRVTIEVPAHWHVRDLDERKNIAAAGEEITEEQGRKKEPNHVSALSVVSRPEPVGAIIRVSFIPIDDLSQASLKQELQADRSGVLREITGAFKEDMDALRASMEKQGLQILGQEKVGIDTIGGLTAFTFMYRRTSAVGPSPFTVTQYHVPVGKEKVLITLSYRESDGRLFGLILDRVKRSVTIK